MSRDCTCAAQYLAQAIHEAGCPRDTMSETVQSSTRTQLDGEAVYADVRAVLASDMSTELTDSSAVTIAAWWQSPGAVGRHLATLASGLPVDLEDLLNDIHLSRRELLERAGEDERALDCLATWAINHSSRTERVS